MNETENADNNSPRAWWFNCGVAPDKEMRAIDALEDELAPLSEATVRIRKLIGTLEMCHHKAERWVHNVIEAIGAGDTSKGLGTRPTGQSHPVENDWRAVCAALSAWRRGEPANSINLILDNEDASHMLNRLGPHSPLKAWQVQRIIERISEFIDWTKSQQDESAQYVPILEYGSDYGSARRTECPNHYREHADFWQHTVDATILHTENGQPAKLPLAVAIDLLMPCNWNFINNLEIALAAIGGNFNPDTPFAACIGNIQRAPINSPMRSVSHALEMFHQSLPREEDIDPGTLNLLGESSLTKRWLAWSLDKTMRLQLGG